MAQECGFFNAEYIGQNDSGEDEFDRVYLAEQFAAYFAAFIGNGVYGHSMQKLQVLCQDVPDMSIKVLSGEAYINGWWYRNKDTYNIQVPIADGVLSRIDVVVLRWGSSERDMWLQLIVGTPSSRPVKPAIRRDADYYDLQLATIEVSNGLINVTQIQIKDTRLDNSVCGLVTGVVDQIDTTNLYNQFESYFQDFKDKYEADYDTWTKEQKQAYLDYVAYQKGLYDKYIADLQDDYDTWTDDKKTEWSTWVNEQEAEFTQWIVSQESAFTQWVDNEKFVYETWTDTQKQAYTNWYDTNTSLWEKQFNDWFDGIKNKLSGEVAGDLQNQINELDAKQPKDLITEIEHNADSYIHCDLYEVDYLCGTQLFGEGPAGGGPLISSPLEYEMDDTNHVKIKAIGGLGEVEEVRKIDEESWVILFKNNFKSLIAIIRGIR